MIRKKQYKLNFQKLKRNLSIQILNLRIKKKLTIGDITNQSEIPFSFLEKLKLPQVSYINPLEIQRAASFFNKTIKLTFENIQTEIQD